jgi:hypothetical protein
MRNIEKKVWLGLLSMVGLIAPFSNSANALDNNLLIKQPVEVLPAPKGAFLVSKDKILEKYKNSHKLTNEQLIELLEAVGFKGKTLRSACAIAMAETNARPLAFNGNPETGDSSYGIFQINMIGNLGPDRRERFELDSNFELFNPVKNAQITHHMTKGGKDWSSWTTLNGSRYQEWYNKYPCKV